MVDLYVKRLRKVDHIQKEIRNEKVTLFNNLLIFDLCIDLPDICAEHLVGRELANRKHGARDRLRAVRL